MPFVSFFCHKFVIRKFILPLFKSAFGDKSIYMTEVAYTNIQSKTKKEWSPI